MWLVSKEKGGLETQANGVFPPDKNKIQKSMWNVQWENDMTYGRKWQR